MGDVSKEQYSTKQVVITAADLVSEQMRFGPVTWVVPGVRTWVFDLDAMKKVFPGLAGLHWLAGMLSIDPEINTPPPSLGGYYHQEVKFYLSPSIVGEHRLYAYTPDTVFAYEAPKHIVRTNMFNPDAEIAETMDMLELRFSEQDRL